ncbi:LOW QUALITY PROTEIN: hypothetical protein U9M48_037771 [Paspalum notatum var. saurae]|uniref:Uncharacterized protein n=1 Tax=Paspalum notatum var. saurae TaxID=547442 RepID=A0AAQ3UJW8_PASNO
MHRSPMSSDSPTTTTTACAAALGRPAPSSLDTRTLTAALRPMKTITSQPSTFMQTPSALTATSASWRSPVSTAQHDGRLQRQPEEGGDVVEGGGRPAPPPVPAPPHDVGRLRQRDDPVRGVVGERGAEHPAAQHDDEELSIAQASSAPTPIHAGTTTLLCACRNLPAPKLRPMAKMAGRMQTVNLAASRATSWSCPISSSSGSAKTKKGDMRSAEAMRMIQERCRYTPSMPTCPAPYACPHSVSSALPMPSRKPSAKLMNTVRPMEAPARGRVPR